MSVSRASTTSTTNSTMWWLIGTNAIMALGWLHVLWNLLQHMVTAAATTTDAEPQWCEEQLQPAISIALYLSFLELVSASTGMTRSKPLHVLLFAVVRWGTEKLVAPRLASCQAWQHLGTVVLWSLGDAIRFSCFAVDALTANPPAGSGGRATTTKTTTSVAKTVRYTVGPWIFPAGAAGEMLMVLGVAVHQKQPAWYFAAALWPVGFYPLYRQLLRQRNKYRWQQEQERQSQQQQAKHPSSSSAAQSASNNVLQEPVRQAHIKQV